MIFAARKLCFSIFSSTCWRGSLSLELAPQELGVGGDPGERRVDLVGDAGGEEAHRGHLLGVLQLLLEAHAGGHVVEDEDRAVALAGRGLEGRHRDVHHEAAAVRRGQVQLVDVRDLLVVAEDERAAQRLEEAPRGRRRRAPGRGPRCRGRPSSASIARFQRTTRPSRSSTTMPESRLSRMFSLYSLSPRSSSAFSLQAAEQAPVHDRGGRLRGERLQGVDLLAVERVEAVLAAHAEHRDHLALHPAGEEPGEAGGGEARALAGRGVHVDGLARGEPGEERAARRDPRAALAGARHAAGAERARGRRPRRAGRGPSRAGRARRRCPRGAARSSARGRGRR